MAARRSPARFRVAVLATHPIQYQSQWFRRLAAHPALHLRVYFCHRARPDQQAEAGFNVPFDWDVPLLEGFEHHFLENVAREPTIASFRGLDSPEIGFIIRRERFDAVVLLGWSHKSAWQAAWACRRNGTPVLVRGDSHLRTRRSPTKRAAKRLIHGTFIPRFDACLAVGAWSEQYFRHYGARRVFTVPHSIDRGVFGHRAPDRESACLENLGLPSESTVFVLAAKLADAKRPMDFVRAVERAARDGTQLSGLIIGDGPSRRELEEYVRTRDLPVRFAGFVNQSRMASMYRLGDVLVVPSSETWGIVVNEAMSCGLPCIVSDAVGCNPDLISAGVTGHTFPLGDIPALAALLKEYAGKRCSLPTMGADARRMESAFADGPSVDGFLDAVGAVSRELSRTNRTKSADAGDSILPS
jgi:glycosyltransferase involved in cell wall biosynthesis